MIEWIEYFGYNRFRPSDFSDGYEPTVLEEGRTYLICTENGAVLVRPWYGLDKGGFKTTGPRCASNGNTSDTNVLYYAELNLPEELEALKKYDSVPRLALEIVRLKKMLREKGEIV